MKKDTFCKLTGLTQEETAIWLCVGQSQWSMFESGKRSLPLKSMMSIASLVNFIETSNDISKETEALLANENKKLIDMLQKQLQTTELDLIRIQKKIKRTEEKRNKCLTALNAAFFIENVPNKDFPNDLPRVIKYRCIKTLKNYPLSKLELMRLKAQSLEEDKVRVLLKLKKAEAY